MKARLGGGALLLAGLLGMGLVVIALSGGAVGLGTSDANGLLLGACSAALGLGAGLLSLSARSGYPTLLRLALGLDAVGWIGLAVSARANTGPDTSPLLLVLLVSLALAAIGAVVTSIGLLRMQGLLRLAGVVLLVGVVGLALENGMWSAPSTVLVAGIPLGFFLVGLVSVRRASSSNA